MSITNRSNIVKTKDPRRPEQCSKLPGINTPFIILGRTGRGKHKNVFVVPQLLIAEGIPFKTIRQLPGDYVITFPVAFATTGDQTLDQTSVEEYMPLLHHLPQCKVFFFFLYFFFNFET
jgi:hypothetical protein